MSSPKAVGSVVPVWRALIIFAAVGTSAVAALTASVMLLTKPWMEAVAAARSSEDESGVMVDKVESKSGRYGQYITKHFVFSFDATY